MKFRFTHWSKSLLLVSTVVLTAAVAYCHSMYQSAVMLDFVGSEIHAELQLPLERLSAAFGHPINSQTLQAQPSGLDKYIACRFQAKTPDGNVFQTRLSAPLNIATVDGAPYVVARLVLTAPPHARTDVFDIEDDVILDRIPSQVALVSIRSDWSTSIFANDPQLIGVLRSSSRSLAIDHSDGGWFRGFESVFRLGMRHIAEGTDHLLFLLALLLPAPLLVAGGRWAGVAGVRRSLVRILRIVTAFTAGHSITLALATLGFVRVPSRPVEVFIAVSILVSAVHALRPIFPGREAGIAAFFGLIHGLAFATTLGELGLGRWDRVASIFAFNLGIETMQIVVVAATLPSLILLSRTPAYSALRIGGGLFAGFSSIGWVAERVLNVHTPVDSIVNAIAHRSVLVVSGLFFTSLILWFAKYATGRFAWMQEMSPGDDLTAIHRR